MIGRTLSHYEILDEVGRGGMGIVYRALDLRLHREVALKILPPELVADPERKRRFEQEARAAAALKHPNIGVIYEIDEADDVTFIAMELIEGEKLSDVLRRERVPVSRAVGIATDVAEALARAHDKAIVHRDLKPANIMVTDDGHAKVIDFGLAKLLEPLRERGSAVQTATRLETRSDVLMGTVFYMSPEQALGRPVDGRSDLFSLGVTLYEMATGRRPFEGDTAAAVFDAILHDAPSPVRKLDKSLPASVGTIIERLLEKDPDRRFQSAKELVEALRAPEVAGTGVPSGTFVARQASRSRWAQLGLGALLLAVLLGVRAVRRSDALRVEREEAISRILRLIEDESFSEAFAVAQQVEAFDPDRPILPERWPEFTRLVTVRTEPEGALVYLQDYQAPESPWQALGPTPLSARIPREFFRWRVEKQGYTTVETAAFFVASGEEVSLERRLFRTEDAPTGMVHVEARSYYLDFAGLEHFGSVELGEFWLDRHEVTNALYKAFVDAGGYDTREYWEHEFLDGGRRLSWDEAMAQFVDATGRPGPATWELGDYPDGRGDYPVTGVSWYEAAAYAKFAGKMLPTLYHWGRAAGTWLGDEIVQVSNFHGEGVAPVGRYPGTSPSGAYDMAGNVKEWVWNAAGENHYIVGGAWDEPVYMFNHPDAQEPMRRQGNYGLRCMKIVADSEPLPDTVTGPLVGPVRDFDAVEPIPENEFEIYRRLYAYDRRELNAVVEWKDQSSERWTAEKVSFDAAYGNDRMAAFVYLPKRGTPPFQAVVYFPGSEAIHLRSSGHLRRGPSGGSEVLSDQGGLGGIDFLLRSGRAVIYPIYKGTYERGDELRSNYPYESAFYRDHVIMWSQDLGRSIDYALTRPDIGDKIAYYGYSWGAQLGAILPALEPRIGASILVAGGFKQQQSLPEADQATFAPYVTTPTLMLNGRYDFFFVLEKSQIPMFERLGAPPSHKRHVVFDSGHTIPRREGIREILDWLDTYLGPVD